MSDKTHIVTGNIIFGTNGKSASKKGFDQKSADRLKSLMSSNSLTGKNESEDFKENKRVNREKELSQIQDRSWENVDSSSSSKKEYNNGKQIINSSNHTEKLSDTNVIPSGKTSIFDAEAFKRVQNSEFTQNVIDSAKERRVANKERVERDRSWEVEDRAKTTADVPASMMGFTPHRSSFVPSELPQKKESVEITSERSRVQQSKEAGERLAKMRTEEDKAKQEVFLNDMNDKSHWQDFSAKKISQALNVPITQATCPVKVGEGGVYREKKYDKDLSGIFKSPMSPEEYKEANIKRDTKDLKQNRESGRDDRSWETPENKSKK